MSRTLCQAVCLSIVVLPSALQAVDFVVTRYDDPFPTSCSNQCSLREAVIAANQTPGPDRIILSAGVYELTLAGNQEHHAFSGDLDLRDDVEILGVAANLTIIDGNYIVERVFEVPVTEDIDVRIADLALTRATGVSGGSAVRVQRTNLIIERCEIFGNLGGTASVAASAFSTLSVRDSTVRGNGGGVSCSQSDCLLANVTLTDNGPVELEGTIGSLLTCQHCTIYDSSDEVVIELDLSALQIGDSVIRGTCAPIGLGAFVFSAGGNLESPGHTCGLSEASDVDDVFTAALLDLAPNGGATLTRRPQIGAPSAAGAVACLPELDQTGLPRPASGCSRGAVQASTVRTLIPVFIDGFEQGDAEAWSATTPSP